MVYSKLYAPKQNEGEIFHIFYQVLILNYKLRAITVTELMNFIHNTCGVHNGIQKEMTEIVMQKTEKLLRSPLRAQASSSVGSTDTQRTILEDPDTRGVDRILLDEPHLKSSVSG